MMPKKRDADSGTTDASLHFANRNATKAGKTGNHSHFANDEDTGRRLEQVSANLYGAAMELESLLCRVHGADGQADLSEAIGSIMETLQLIAAAHTKLGPAAAE